MIFLSYRQTDTTHLVGRLRDRLIARYGGGGVVFRDKTGIAPGKDWGAVLEAEVTARPVVLVVIGKGWAEARYAPEHGNPERVGELRLDDPEDWVRREVHTALNQPGKVVVPVLAGGAHLPHPAWLAKRDMAGLDKKQYKSVNDDPVFDDDFEALCKAIEAECPTLGKPPPSLPPSSPGLPAKPPVCVGRDDLLAKLDALFLPKNANARLPALAVAGVGGIGKSTAALWFLHDDRVRRRYGDRRHFVPLDGAADRSAVVGKLAEYLGVPLGPHLEPRVLAALEQGERRLLVLDNAETPLQTDHRLAVEDLLGSLAAFAHVGLVATLRPDTPLPNWETPELLGRLAEPAARVAFDRYSGGKFAADPDAAAFVATLDGWPLVLRLAAEQAKHHRHVAEFRGEWEKKRAELLEQGPDKGSNFAVSVGLSLDCPKLTPAGRRLLAVLARLPDGLLHDDLSAVLGDDGVAAAKSLREAGGLMTEDADRLWLLAPLREHLAPLLPFDGADRDRAVRYFCDLAEAGRGVRTPERMTKIEKLERRTGACVAMIAVGLGMSDRRTAYLAAVGLGECGRFVGLNFTDILTMAVDVARIYGEILFEAYCIEQMGTIAFARTDHAVARLRYETALPLFQKVGYVLGEANCVFRLGNIALRRSNYEEARRQFEAALPLYQRVGDALGEGNCALHLGLIAFARSDLDYAEARRLFDHALPLFRQARSVLGEANCTSSLGGIAFEQPDYFEARRRFEAAIPLFQQVDSVLGEASCVKRLGDIALAEDDPTTARRQYEAALALYQRIEEPYSIGWTYRRLARIATDPAERSRFAAAARAAWLSIDRPDLVAELDAEFPPGPG